MKMVYERPVMSAEQFVTNAYCGPCVNGTPVMQDTGYQTGATGWFSPRQWKPGILGIPYLSDDDKALTSEELSGYILGHTFAMGDATPMTRPSGVEDAGQTQYYWTCSCTGEHAHEGTYYLEYSTEWAKDYQNENVFVLYKETNNTAGLQINFSNGGVLPSVSSGYDAAIGAVRVDVNQVQIGNQS